MCNGNYDNFQDILARLILVVRRSYELDSWDLKYRRIPWIVR